MRDTLLRRFKQNGGFLRSADSLTAAEKYHLRRLINEGLISRVKRGLYRMNDYPGIFQEAEVARMIPSGIFCMFTAWSNYCLTTFVSAEYHIAVPKSYKIVLPKYPPVKLYYWDNQIIDLGKTSKEINDAFVTIYDLERSVCDAVRFRNKIGTDLLGEILRNYIHHRDKNLDRLMKYASQLRISNILNELLQVIL